MPLSLCQELLCSYLAQVGGFDSAAYNLFRVLELRGALNVTALEQTLNEILRRHEVLRTTLRSVGGRLVQTIAPQHNLLLPVINLQHLSAPEDESHVYELVADDIKKIFDLSRDLLLRATLFQLERDRHILTLTTHHTFSDGWSMNILLREVVELYKAFSDGRAPALPVPAVQYADFAHWQRHWTQGEYLEELLSYSKKHLIGASSVSFPGDYPRPETASLRGAHESFTLGPDLSGALKTFSRREGGTLFMTLLTAFKVLLYKHTGHDDLAVLTPAANRTRSEVEGTIGYFSNYLLIRTLLSGDPTFRELLARVREVTLDAFDHQDLPLIVIMRELNLDWVPVMFSFMPNVRRATASSSKLAITSSDPSGLDIKLMDIDPNQTICKGTSKRELTLSVFEGVEEIRGTAEYSTDLYADATISKMLSDYRLLLEKIVGGSEQRLSTLCGSR